MWRQPASQPTLSLLWAGVCLAEKRTGYPGVDKQWTGSVIGSGLGSLACAEASCVPNVFVFSC